MSNRLVKLGLAGFLFYITVFVVGLCGWIANIVKIIHHINEPISALEIFRMIGVIAAPLGAVLGFV